jgi:hypothetical protein
MSSGSRGIKMLRYFYEEYPDLYFIAAGSLLEFALKEVPSFPVGRVKQLSAPVCLEVPQQLAEGIWPVNGRFLFQGIL